MNLEEFKDLDKGDVIKTEGSGNIVVIHGYDGESVMIALIQAIDNYEDWKIVAKDGSNLRSPTPGQRVIQILSDGRCDCGIVDGCPLGRVGGDKRCTGEELYRAGMVFQSEDGTLFEPKNELDDLKGASPLCHEEVSRPPEDVDQVEIKFRVRQGRNVLGYEWLDKNGRWMNSIKGAWPILPIERDQYTGLKDKNEHELYKGDLVRIGIGTNFPKVGEVKWLKDGWICGAADLHPLLSNSVGGQTCEKIGNVYENPKLKED